MALQSIFSSRGEHMKLCLAADGFGSRLCRLETMSNRKVKKLQVSLTVVIIISICRALHKINITMCFKS